MDWFPLRNKRRNQDCYAFSLSTINESQHVTVGLLHPSCDSMQFVLFVVWYWLKTCQSNLDVDSVISLKKKRKNKGFIACSARIVWLCRTPHFLFYLSHLCWVAVQFNGTLFVVISHLFPCYTFGTYILLLLIPIYTRLRKFLRQFNWILLVTRKTCTAEPREVLILCLLLTASSSQGKAIFSLLHSGLLLTSSP